MARAFSAKRPKPPEPGGAWPIHCKALRNDVESMVSVPSIIRLVRSATLLAATLAAGVAALVGGVGGPSGAATVMLMGVWGFAGGLLLSVGTRAAFVGMLSTWALLLAGGLHLHGGAGWHEAWLITAGGLLQTVVAIATWPLQPFAAESHAVADAYRALAAYARAPGTAALQGTAAAFATAAEAVGAGAALPGERGTLRALVEQGEWIRLELAALARADVPGVGRTLTATAKVLDAVIPALKESGFEFVALSSIQPNQALEPMPLLRTPSAGAEAAPSKGMAHL